MDENKIMSNIDDVLFDGLKITLKGKDYYLDYCMAGLKYLTKKYESVTKVIEKVGKIDTDFTTESIDFVCDMLYAGLISNNENLKLSDVERMISFNNIGYCFQKICTALTDSLPNAKEGDLKN